MVISYSSKVLISISIFTLRLSIGRRRDLAIRATGYKPVDTVYDIKVTIVRGLVELRGLTPKDAIRGRLYRRKGVLLIVPPRLLLIVY